MIRIKLSSGNTTIIEDGVIYTFNKMGKFVEKHDKLHSVNLQGALDLPTISFLTSNGNVDIGVSFGNDTFKRYTVVDSIKAMVSPQLCKGFIKLLEREGVQDNIKFKQLIFIYPQGTNLQEILNKIEVKEA